MSIPADLKANGGQCYANRYMEGFEAKLCQNYTK